MIKEIRERKKEAMNNMEEDMLSKSEIEEAQKEASLLRNIDFILVDELKQLVELALEEHGLEEKLIQANQVADMIIEKLTYDKLLSEQTHQTFVDIMVSAALLHNLFYKEEDWRTLFDAKFYLEPVAEDLKINHQITETLFHTIQGQLGAKTPVVDCIPKPGTPTEMFANIVWTVKNYLTIRLD